MADKTQTSFSNRFKARIALQIIEGASASDLSHQHGVAEDEINAWASKLKTQAEFLFLDEVPLSDESDLKKAGSDQSYGVKEYAALLSTTFEAIPGGVMVVDLDGRVVTYNHACMDMWGIPHEVVATGDINKAMDYVVKQLKNPQEFKKNVKQLYDHPEKESRHRFEFEDGRIFERYSIPHRLGGEIVGRVTSFVDITDQVMAEEKARRFGDLLDSITTNVNEGIIRSTPEEGLVFVNNAFAEMFGYASTEEAKKTKPEFYYADQKHRWELVEELQKMGQLKNEEVLFKRKDGSTFWGLENSILIQKEDQLYIDAVINDISEMKMAEEALQKSEEKYRSILRNIEEGYYESDLEGNLTFFNRPLVEMLGYSPVEMHGMNNREFMDEENANKVFDSFNKVYKTEKSQRGFDWELTRKDGQRIIVEASVNLIKSEDNNSIGFRGIIRDVTERKKREEQIKASLKEKEILLGEIHHRVKNNLAIISGLLFLQAEKTDEASAQDLLMQSQSRINSMGIVHELLYENRTFSSINPRKYIEQLTRQINQNLNIGEKEIETVIDAGDLELDMNLAIPCALIINELLTNAYKYAFEGKDSGLIEVFMNQKEDQVELIVTDDGVGIDGDKLEGNYEEGLGLFLVHTLTQQIEGKLQAENNNGSRFRITFPVA